MGNQLVSGADAGSTRRRVWKIRAGQAVKDGRRIAVINVILDLCIVPIGVGVSLSTYVAACEKVLTEAGLKIRKDYRNHGNEHYPASPRAPRDA